MTPEFALIDRLFRRPTRHTRLGIGDDAALVAVAPGHELAVSTDLLVEGTHFLPTADAASLGWKTLAVNVSDMAAMGVQPRWATLGIAIPPTAAAAASWLEAFADGFFACAQAFDIDLIGGDTTRGHDRQRCFAVTIFGEVPSGTALRRDGAKVGDTIWVSGHPGRAALGLAQLQGRTALPEGEDADCLNALHKPQPRLALGLALRGIAHSAIDVSDGLLADLGHILESSACAACLSIPDLPPAGIRRDAFLAGGDDYELVFTAAAAQDVAVGQLARTLDLPLHRIGHIESGAAGRLRLLDSAGGDITPARRGFDHFV